MTPAYDDGRVVVKKRSPDREELRRLYWEEGLLPREIATRFGISKNTVATLMRRGGIPRRSRAEGMRLSHQHGHKIWRAVSVPLKAVLRCRLCGWVWARQVERISTPCPRCGKIIDARRRKCNPQRGDLAKLLRWPKRKSGKAGYADLRRSVLLLVGRGDVRCVRCRCDRPELLEINHKNGGGAKEIKVNPSKFYWDIVALRRRVDDLELLCKVCNALHALELRFGRLPFEVRYIG